MTETQRILRLLQDYESRNVTWLAPDGAWPIVWARTRGMHVWDVERRRYLDMTAAFGVAAAGHANPAVVRAGQKQMACLLHAMGDVHPHTLKAELARLLSRLTFERWAPERLSSVADSTSDSTPAPKGKVIFGNSGFEAVEAALKTALIATGKPGVIAFEQGYHGLGYGALNATHRDHFRSPFRSQLREFGHFAPFPASVDELDAVESAIRLRFAGGQMGAVLVEPVQGRGGIRTPPRGFLALLRRLCDAHGALLIADEIYTGFGRTGRWFACEHEPTVPDLICLGKALTGGFPLSACVGKAELMDRAWPEATGEAIHTSTFLGHPVGCAMALAQIGEIERLRLVERSARLGECLLAQLQQLPIRSARFRLRARGLGLMAGVEIRHRDERPAGPLVFAATRALLKRGFIALPEGADGEVLSFTPPLIVTRPQILQATRALADVLKSLERP